MSLVFSQQAAELVDLGPGIGPNITFLGERVGRQSHVENFSRRRVDAGAAAGRRALLGFFGAGGPDDLRYTKYFYADAAAVFSFLFRRPVAPASPRGARSFFSAFFSVSFGVSARSTSSRNTMGAPSPGRGPALMIRV